MSEEQADKPAEEAPASEAQPEEVKQQEVPKPENPLDALREQALQLVSDENKSQLAALIKSMLEHKPASNDPARSEAPVESERVAERYEVAPFRPRITREAKRFDASKYGSISGD